MLKLFLPLVVLLLGFLLLELRIPLGSITKIGADEHYELSKATLLNHGYKLYTEIWNDQPPLITIIIANISQWTPHSALAPRLMTVAFTALLLASLFCLVRSVSGIVPATIGVIMLLSSPGFLELSSSVMQEIPALASVLAALTILWLGPKTNWFLTEIIAGSIFGFGLQLKLIGLAYLPLAGLIVLLRNSAATGPAKCTQNTGRRRTHFAVLLKSAGVFGIITAATFVVLNYATGNSLLLELRQAWAAHFASAQSFEYGSPADYRFDWSLLMKNWETTVPAAVGVVVLLLRCKCGLRVLLPLVWVGLGFLVFATHKPWWPYYYIHTALPLCWSAGIGIEWLWRRFRRGSPLVVSKQKSPTMETTSTSRSWISKLGFSAVAAFSLLSPAWMGARIYLEQEGMRSAGRIETALVLKEIERFKPFVNFMFSDRPIYSFYADLPMPPHLAILSLKRFWTGDLDNQRLASELQTIRPGLILLSRLSDAQLPYQELLDREYKLVYQDNENLLFAHQSISQKPLL